MTNEELEKLISKIETALGDRLCADKPLSSSYAFSVINEVKEAFRTVRDKGFMAGLAERTKFNAEAHYQTCLDQNCELAFCVDRRNRDSVQLPNEDEINEEVANGFDWAFDHLKTTVPLAYEYGLRAGISWLRSQLKTVQKGKFCPCGGIILADTEEFTTPLCCECYEEVLRSEPVQPISDEELDKLAPKGPALSHDFERGYRAAEARILGVKK